MSDKSEIGALGERLAARYLMEKQYKTIKTNFRQVFGEIDIITRAPDETLVFVEVKTLSGGHLSDLNPEDEMTRAKLAKFRKICQFFAARFPKMIDERAGWRMDVVAIVLDADGQPRDIRHYENI